MTQTNFLQVTPQTRKQKIDMYMKMPKRKIIEMLLARDVFMSAFNFLKSEPYYYTTTGNCGKFTFEGTNKIKISKPKKVRKK